ncbi:hypothetical protein PUN28_020918 [Cardiocondyla obscurior]|uniref:Uncharacterized protein n=1 Tax=Cardiocondyla obscurior TaxID=286306 RepID=A0AAW2E8B4_9HYME
MGLINNLFTKKLRTSRRREQSRCSRSTPTHPVCRERRRTSRLSVCCPPKRIVLCGCTSLSAYQVHIRCPKVM